MRGSLLVLALWMLTAGSAYAQNGSGPRETVDQTYTFTTYDNQLDILNNANEQIMVISNGSLGNTVVRGQMQPDGSVTFAAPTCFPVPPAGVPCARDYVLQTGSTTTMPVYTRNGRAY